MFDERERIETIFKILEQEIDFNNLMLSGVIVSHGPMMKRKVFADIEENYYFVKYKLLTGFIKNTWEKHFNAVNIIKSYYGEKAAF